jgi:hypothetical protein
MRTISEPARYSPSRTEVTMEMPARRSEPNSRWTRLVQQSEDEGDASEH